MTDTYRTLVAARPLIPGTRMTLRADAGDLRPGSRVLVVMRSGGADQPEGIHEVGTIGLVWGVERAVDRPDFIEVRGEVLASIESIHGPEPLADVVGVEEGGDVDAGLLSEVQAALRTYLGAAAEAGEGGDVGITLKADPVIASHQVASLVRISAPELQEVLEAGSASARLERVVGVLRRETGLLRNTMGGRGA